MSVQNLATGTNVRLNFLPLMPFHPLVCVKSVQARQTRRKKTRNTEVELTTSVN
jgi:hypothetical protein